MPIMEGAYCPGCGLANYDGMCPHCSGDQEAYESELAPYFGSSLPAADPADMFTEAQQTTIHKLAAIYSEVHAMEADIDRDGTAVIPVLKVNGRTARVEIGPDGDHSELGGEDGDLLL